MLSREEILAIYVAGPEAVVDLVERLLAQQAEVGATGRNQVFAWPPLRPIVIEHLVWQACYPQCQSVTTGQFPPEVTQTVQHLPGRQVLGYGAGVKSVAVYLQEYTCPNCEAGAGQQIPSERSQELFQDVLDLSLSEGALANARETCARRLEPVETAIKQVVTQATVVNFDETGGRSAGRTNWLHVAGTPGLTYFAVHAQHGQRAMNAIGILPAFHGTAVPNGLHAYMPYAGAHILCTAHLLRDLTAAAEMNRQRRPQQMSDRLLVIKVAVEQARAAGQTQLSRRRRKVFLQRYAHLIRQNLRSNPPLRPRIRGRGRQYQGPRRNMFLRLIKQRSAVLAFMHDFQGPFDNNLAERDLRMIRVRQRITGGFRSWRGAEIVCIIRGYNSTLRKQAENVLAMIGEAINNAKERNRPWKST